MPDIEDDDRHVRPVIDDHHVRDGDDVRHVHHEKNPPRPSDLIDLDEAARLSERTRRTLRRWVENGSIQKWNGDIQKSGIPSPLVSRAGLMSFLVTREQRPRTAVQKPQSDGHAGHDDRHVRPVIDDHHVRDGDDVHHVHHVHHEKNPPDPHHLDLEREVLRLRHEAEIKELRSELKQVRLEAELERVRLEVGLDAAQKALVEVNQSNQRLVADLRQNNERLRLEKQDWKDRHDAREAELNALRSAIGIPWWRRLLSMKDG